jgi:hypothetical protein
MSQPNSLWEVEYDNLLIQYEKLWILASTAAKAATKALKFLRHRDGKHKRITITSVKYRGTIDVF